jgi:phosphoglycerol transferase MdoB-like AlkP superfamily enzyme
MTALLASGIALGCFWISPERPLRVDENRFANELAANGVYNLFSAFRNNELEYAPFYVTEESDTVSRRLRRLLAEPAVRFADDDPIGLTREVIATRPERDLNVVLIVVESLSARFLGAFGNSEGLTPNLDRLAREGLLFTNLHATGTRTVRGLEAIALSLPPTPGYSIVKRPRNANLPSLGSVFREHGYRARFFYGGYSYFDNMGPFFAGNGFDVIDRSDLSGDEAGFANAWGVADEFVLRRVLREARRSHDSGERFLSLVLTTSNHRPFTYPGGRVDVPSGDGRDGAVKYTDFAIGQFVEQARMEPFFDDTVFVIVADHCASSAGELDIPIEQYHIPMIVYAPANVAPGRMERLASQMDVTPTMLGLLGFSYRSRFFGRDMLAADSGAERALLGTYQRLGYLKDGMLTVLSPFRRIDVYRIEPGGQQTPVMPRAAGDDVDEAIAYYQSASAALANSAE